MHALQAGARERERESVRSQRVRDDRERDGRRARAWRVRCAAVCVYGRSCVVSSPCVSQYVIVHPTVFGDHAQGRVEEALV